MTALIGVALVNLSCQAHHAIVVRRAGESGAEAVQSLRAHTQLAPFVRLCWFVVYDDDLRSQFRLVLHILPAYVRVLKTLRGPGVYNIVRVLCACSEAHRAAGEEECVAPRFRCVSAHSRHATQRELAPRFLFFLTKKVAWLFALLTLSYGWLGVVLFPRFGSGSGVEAVEEGEAYFRDLPTATWSLVVLTTTSNFPDIMIPAYNHSRWACVYFVTFLLLSLFLLMNLLLATATHTPSRVYRRKPSHVPRERERGFLQARRERERAPGVRGDSCLGREERSQ